MSGVRTWECPYCNQLFVSKQGMQGHVNKPACQVLIDRAAQAPSPEPASRRWRQRMQTAGGAISWEPARGDD